MPGNQGLGTARTSIHHDATTPIAGVVFLVWQLLFIRAASCIKVEHVLENKLPSTFKTAVLRCGTYSVILRTPQGT